MRDDTDPHASARGRNLWQLRAALCRIVCRLCAYSRAQSGPEFPRALEAKPGAPSVVAVAARVLRAVLSADTLACYARLLHSKTEQLSAALAAPPTAGSAGLAQPLSHCALLQLEAVEIGTWAAILCSDRYDAAVDPGLAAAALDALHRSSLLEHVARAVVVCAGGLQRYASSSNSAPVPDNPFTAGLLRESLGTLGSFRKPFACRHLPFLYDGSGIGHRLDPAASLPGSPGGLLASPAAATAVRLGVEAAASAKAVACGPWLQLLLGAWLVEELRNVDGGPRFGLPSAGAAPFLPISFLADDAGGGTSAGRVPSMHSACPLPLLMVPVLTTAAVQRSSIGSSSLQQPLYSPSTVLGLALRAVRCTRVAFAALAPGGRDVSQARGDKAPKPHCVATSGFRLSSSAWAALQTAMHALRALPARQARRRAPEAAAELVAMLMLLSSSTAYDVVPSIGQALGCTLMALGEFLCLPGERRPCNKTCATQSIMSAASGAYL